MKVAVFRPDDDRLTATVDRLEALGVTPIADPMLAIEPTGAVPRSDADYVVFTSRTGVDLAVDGGWVGSGRLCAIGEATADALRSHGHGPDRVPADFSSEGLVAALADEVAGERVEVARSDHGRAALVRGLVDAGAYVHETVLYGLDRPPAAGRSAELAAAGDLAGVLFTSSLTVEHFLEAAAERGVRTAALEGLETAVVGAIGDPTRAAAAERGIDVDVVPSVTDADALAEAVVDRLDP